jgi:hypothetical protein
VGFPDENGLLTAERDQIWMKKEAVASFVFCYSPLEKKL